MRPEESQGLARLLITRNRWIARWFCWAAAATWEVVSVSSLIRRESGVQVAGVCLGFGGPETRNPRTTTRNASLATMVGRRIVGPRCGSTGVFLFLTASAVSGQQPGDSVRVSGELVGVVVDADSAGLLLSSAYPPYAGMRTLEVPYAGMRSLEVWGGYPEPCRAGVQVGVRGRDD